MTNPSKRTTVELAILSLWVFGYHLLIGMFKLLQGIERSFKGGKAKGIAAGRAS
jgi:hypothetical protein